MIAQGEPGAHRVRADESQAQLRAFLAAFTRGVPEGARLVTELRALNCPRSYGKPATEFGFFDLGDADGLSAFCAAVKSLTDRPVQQQPSGVYATFNPLQPELLARVNTRLKVSHDTGETAADKNVTGRRWLVIDVDPKRIARISSSDVEKARAKFLIDGVREDLDGRGWSPPMLVDSGNGYHLWYPVELPADDGGRVERALKALARMHDTPAAKLDTSVFNPSRIAKLPGTWARKGDSTPERPHRMARLLEAPE
jgi:hypothetical protein